jgi:hypothetical protein
MGLQFRLTAHSKLFKVLDLTARIVFRSALSAHFLVQLQFLMLLSLYSKTFLTNLLRGLYRKAMRVQGIDPPLRPSGLCSPQE